MQITTFSDLAAEKRELAKSLDLTDNTIIKAASGDYRGRDVFLSHSSLDKEILTSAVALLERMECTFYVDFDDKRLPMPPTPKTAEIIHDVITSCRRVVVIITENTKSSRWIPWELGLAHAYKGLYPVAVWPISTKRTEEYWSKQEYFGVYPRIGIERLEGEEGLQWVVQIPGVDNRYWDLWTWLKFDQRI